MDTIRDDELDILLNRSAAETTELTGDVARAIEQMAVESKASGAASHRRPISTKIALGLAAVGVLGGTATAAAAVGGPWLPWVPWAEAPDAVVMFTLPSGAECEQRIGRISGMDPAVNAVVQDFFRTTDEEALLENGAVDEVIADFRARGGMVFMNEDGTTEPADFGTEHYSADSEYFDAAGQVIGGALDEVLAASEIDGAKSGLSYDSAAKCPGAEW